jgi:hypothetical protein
MFNEALYHEDFPFAEIRGNPRIQNLEKEGRAIPLTMHAAFFYIECCGGAAVSHIGMQKSLPPELPYFR